MPVLEMSELNKKIGICGVLSTIAAVYLNRPGARSGVDSHTANSSNSLDYVYDIICGFLSYLQDNDNEVILETEEITKSFGGPYANWTAQGYLSRGRLEENAKGGAYAMALTPKGILALLEFLGMTGVWNKNDVIGDAIIGLTRQGAPNNRWGNLAHWTYRTANGKWLNNGVVYNSLKDLNAAAGRDYQEIYWISVHN